MTAKKLSKLSCVEEIVAKSRPSSAEVEGLLRLEKKGDRAAFDRALSKLDKKYASIHEPSLRARERGYTTRGHAWATIGTAETVAKLGAGKLLGSGLVPLGGGTEAEPVTPFTFAELHVYDALSGPNVYDVTRGILGAQRWYDDEYRVFNPGDTDGTTRVPRGGYMDLVFTGHAAEAGSYRLLLPTGVLIARGHTNVHGHGNSTTCYDAKVAVSYFSFVTVNDSLIEWTDSAVHSDGTRSEDRTQEFYREIVLPSRYVELQTSGAAEVRFTLRLDVHTEANEDGKASCQIDTYGFYANTKSDYDTVLIRLP